MGPPLCAPNPNTLPPVLDLSQIAALTFDCYGTLVDWETGILKTVRGVLLTHNKPAPSDDQLLKMYADLELQAECGGYRSYRQVLASVLDGIAASCGIRSLPDQDRDAL